MLCGRTVVLFWTAGVHEKFPGQTSINSSITYSAVVVVAGSLAVELAGAKVDVGGAVAVHPGLGNKAGGAGIAGVEGDGLSQALWKTMEKSSHLILSHQHQDNPASAVPEQLLHRRPQARGDRHNRLGQGECMTHGTC
jgi:hypothetical protein